MECAKKKTVCTGAELLANAIVNTKISLMLLLLLLVEIVENRIIIK